MTISIEEIAAYKNNHRRFTVSFFGTPINTVVTSNPSVVRKWLSSNMHKHRLIRNLVVGLGVRWLPHGYDQKQQPAATLQLCFGSRCLIFQLSHAERVPALLRRFLTNPENYLVGVWNQAHKRRLKITRHNLEVGELFDMRHYVNLRRSGEPGYHASKEKIIEEYLGFTGVRFDTDIVESDWNVRDLSEEHIMEACVDAYASFLIGKKARIWESPSPSNMSDDD